MTSQAALVERACAAFASAYGRAPDLVVYAPGRVNLIGEHTDYNDGFVLPCAIDHGTVIALARRDDPHVRTVAADYADAEDIFDVGETIAKRDNVEWANHVRGVAFAFAERGLVVPGANIAIAGNIPQGAGLSSSASLAVGLAQAFAMLGDHSHLVPTDFALIAQASENDFVGCACGIMDQLVSARAEAGHALLIDCRSLEATPIALPPSLSVMIVHSGVRRGLVDSAYNERRAQCEAAAAHYHVRALRDVDEATLLAGQNGFDPIAFRRARHVVTENVRTLAMVEALISNDLGQIGALMAASHASMRDDFEITVPPVDTLVALMADIVGSSGGVRMTGGGFGGCVVALLRDNVVANVIREVTSHYVTPNGGPPMTLICRPSGGASVVSGPQRR
jgi:galactokinase